MTSRCLWCRVLLADDDEDDFCSRECYEAYEDEWGDDE